VIKIVQDSEFINLLRSNLKKSYNSRKRKVEDIIHVSDIIHGQCLRKAYYQRVIDDYEFTDEDIDNFVRGESSEHVLVDLADIGVGQHELYFYEDGGHSVDERDDIEPTYPHKPLLVARPDLLSDNFSDKDGKTGLIVEFKDTKTFERLTPDHYKFKAYLRQLLYYLTISGLEKGVLCIRYASNRKLQWIKRDEQGDYYFSPLIDHETNENKLPELETWSITLDKDSFVRELLKKEIKERALRLRGALDHQKEVGIVITVTGPSNSISSIGGTALELPKVAEEWKCVRCPFLKICDPQNVKEQDKVDDSILENFV
jgi:hypothetical protein